MELIVNGGKGVSNESVKGFLDSLGEQIRRIDKSDLPEALQDFVIEFGDGIHNGQYIYKLTAGNAELENVGTEQELTYYNKETSGVVSKVNINAENTSDALGLALFVGIVGKVFESVVNPIELVDSIVENTIDIKDYRGNKYALLLAGDFRYGAIVNFIFKSDSFVNVLKDKAKFIYNVMKIAMESSARV